MADQTDNCESGLRPPCNSPVNLPPDVDTTALISVGITIGYDTKYLSQTGLLAALSKLTIDCGGEINVERSDGDGRGPWSLCADGLAESGEDHMKRYLAGVKEERRRSNLPGQSYYRTNGQVSNPHTPVFWTGVAAPEVMEEHPVGYPIYVENRYTNTVSKRKTYRRKKLHWIEDLDHYHRNEKYGGAPATVPSILVDRRDYAQHYGKLQGESRYAPREISWGYHGRRFNDVSRFDPMTECLIQVDQEDDWE